MPVTWESAVRRREAASDLINWLRRGGFAPDWQRVFSNWGAQHGFRPSVMEIYGRAVTKTFGVHVAADQNSQGD